MEKTKTGSGRRPDVYDRFIPTGKLHTEWGNGVGGGRVPNELHQLERAALHRAGHHKLGVALEQLGCGGCAHRNASRPISIHRCANHEQPEPFLSRPLAVKVEYISLSTKNPA